MQRISRTRSAIPISWRTRFIVFGVGLALGGGGVAWWTRSDPRAPVYNGQPISELLELSHELPRAYFELEGAVRDLKEEAVPYLMHVLKKKEPTATELVYENIFFRMPQDMRRRLRHPPSPFYNTLRRGTCASLLGLTGSNGVAQVPFLARLSREDESHVRWNAVRTLVDLGPGSEFESVALEALIEAAGETGSEVAKFGYWRLGMFSNRVAEVVPVLLKGLEDWSVRDACFYSLKVLGGTNEPLVRAAIDRGEAEIFREHLKSLQKRVATDEDVLRLKELSRPKRADVLSRLDERVRKR